MVSGRRWIRWGAGVSLGPVLLAGLTAAPANAAPANAAASVRSAAAGPSGVGAKSVVLYDSTTGTTKWTRSPDVKRPIGSITKAMTAVVVIRSGKLGRVVTVKQSYINYAIRHGGSMANLKAGDKLTVGQLLYGLMLPSGCDAAYALADVYGPSWRSFVRKMNSTAKTLGMSKTNYANFDGLPWPSATSGYSTARDLVRLGNYAMKNATFRGIVGKRSYSIPANRSHRAYKWNSTNRLLSSYTGAKGIKTGHTNASGYSLLFAATRNSHTLIGVVLNSSTTVANARFTDAAKVLNWGYGVQTSSALRLPPAQGDTSIP